MSTNKEWILENNEQLRQLTERVTALAEVEKQGQINIGNITTNTLEPTAQASVVITQRYSDADKIIYTDFTFNVPKGSKGADGQNGKDGENGKDGTNGETGTSFFSYGSRLQGHGVDSGNGIPFSLLGKTITDIPRKGDMIYGDSYKQISKIVKVENEQVFVDTAIYSIEGAKGNGINKIVFAYTDESGNNVYNVMDTDGNSYFITCPKGDKGEKGNVGATFSFDESTQTLTITTE